jgi:FAD/FMN-containing dehydrogenase/ferredoxin
MHANDVSVGRAIYDGGPPQKAAPKDFEAKEEALAPGLASEIASLGIRDLRVVSSSGEVALYSRDQSEIPRMLRDLMFKTSPQVVVQPRSSEAVSEILKFAARRRIPVVPRGSASSPFGGSVPVIGGIVVDMSKMDRVLSIDVEKRQIAVQAGARWADIDHLLNKKGFAINTSPSSKFSTVAGWIATGGMGLNSLSRGHLSRSVAEIEVAKSDGSLRKYTPQDPEFPAIFGSEGQLGIITSISLGFRDKPERGAPHLLHFESTKSALEFALALASSDVKPSHIMYESSSKFFLVNRALGRSYFKLAEGVLVNIESEDSERRFAAFIRGMGLVDEPEFLARYMWNERYFPMKIRKFGPGMLGSEVLVPNHLLVQAVSKAGRLCCLLGIDPLFEVHLLSDGRGLVLCYYITDQGNTIRYTLDAVKSMLITAMFIETGARPYSVGIWNTPFSGDEDRSRVAAVRKAKAEMDPVGIMNPGKFFSLSGRLGRLSGILLSPRLVRPALKTMLVFVPITSRLMARAYKFAGSRLTPKTRTVLERVADECAMCGACVSVCPAYLVVGDERVTARGKLLTVKALARGEPISREHAHRIFLCTRCKACEQVCQSKLELTAAYDELEKELEKLCGRDPEEMEKFVRYVESLPEFDALVERGLVVGAPRHGMGGD